MLDTRLRKTHKLTIAVITAVILLPALILVGLYPRMEKAALDKKAKYEQEYENRLEEYEQAEYQWGLEGSFVHMVTEASYYLYGNLLSDASGTFVDMSVLEEYGWIDDYYRIREATDYYVELKDEKETYTSTNASWDMANLLSLSDEEVMNQLDEKVPGTAGFIMLEFNAYGEIGNVRLSMRDWIWTEDTYYNRVMESMDQYMDNTIYWQGIMGEEWNSDELVPKSFRAIFVLNDISSFGYSYYPNEYDYGYYWSWSSLYMDTGAIIPVLAMAAFVALAALLLPFIKKLETGWEKLFCLPFEVIAALTFFGACGAYEMFMIMSQSVMTDIQMIAESENVVLNIIGIPVTSEFLYGVLLVVNFIGWSLCFLAEYIVVTSFRQFLCGPIQYFKERVLATRLLRWVKRQLIRLYNYVTDIDINEKMHSSIIKIVLANFVVVALLCCLWFWGIVGLIIYSIALYILLKRYGEKIQIWYQSLLHTTHQMAAGNLKVQVEDDLGVFQELGTELKEVQKGFSKAVVEEARSQNMKTELITNVSHDLKTPLTAMIIYIDLMKKEDLTEEERTSYVNIVDQKSQRLKVLIEDLFEVSKAASGSIQMNYMDVDVVSLMKQVRLEMEEKIADSDLLFKWNLPEEKLVLSLDGQKTYRIFENLLNNVLKYSLPHSRVYVDILNQDTQAQVMFRNISATELAEDPGRLTERFVRGDASRQTEGSGLGLAIVKSFVELQNGKLDISIDGDLFKVSIVWRK